ncbi:PAX-interacting protein 1-like [Diaphorina citri]|uniref:PAX-interacting protein 1 n=1 Tax=Diaphorina citri TaxID=121845 RepID=A0A1S3DCI8_DIACI|nr:PAX-interacting protein 1-like [Diaphorina citri]
MGPWKAPINVSQEAYDRAKAAGAAQGGPRRKKQKTSHPSGVGGENEDVENSEIPALTLEPLPYENKPRILLSGFAKPLEEEKKVKQLGADMAVSWRDATHLVLANPAQGRTLKFLCALSRVRHIVSGAWLRACLQASHLVDEAEYEVKEIVVSAPDDNDNIKTEPDKEEDPAVAGPDAASQPVPGSGTKRVVCNVPAVLRTGEARARLFAGKTFYLSPSIAPSPGAMRKMIEAAGGSVERQRRSWSKIQDGGLGGEGPSRNEPDKEEDPAVAGPDAASQPVPGSGTKRVVCNVPAVLRTGEARARLFAGKTFYLSPSIAPSPGAMRKMIEAAGGSVERQRRSWSKIQDGGLGGEGPSYLVITCRADLHLVADLLKHDYPIFNTEFVMTSIMTQKIDYSMCTRRAHLNL